MLLPDRCFTVTADSRVLACGPATTAADAGLSCAPAADAPVPGPDPPSSSTQLDLMLDLLAESILCWVGEGMPPAGELGADADVAWVPSGLVDPTLSRASPLTAAAAELAADPPLILADKVPALGEADVAFGVMGGDVTFSRDSSACECFAAVLGLCSAEVPLARALISLIVGSEGLALGVLPNVALPKGLLCRTASTPPPPVNLADAVLGLPLPAVLVV